jgi:hypothetical protein
MEFKLEEKEIKKAGDWMEQQTKAHPADTGAIGGRFTYSFTPNSIGCVVVVRDSVTQEELDVTDYSSW